MPAVAYINGEPVEDEELIAKLLLSVQPPSIMPVMPTFDDYAFARFSVVGGLAVATPDSRNAGNVSRISAGRFRVYVSDPDPLRVLLPSPPTVIDVADLRAGITAATYAYVELRVRSAAGVMTDPAQVLMNIKRSSNGG